MYSVNNFSSKRNVNRLIKGRIYNSYRTFSSCSRYASFRHGSSLCLFALCFIALSVMRYGHLRYASWRYAIRVLPICVMSICVMVVCVMLFFRDGHLQNRIVAIQLWVEAFKIWITLFQIMINEFCHRYTSINMCETWKKRQ